MKALLHSCVFGEPLSVTYRGQESDLRERDIISRPWTPMISNMKSFVIVALIAGFSLASTSLAPAQHAPSSEMLSQLSTPKQFDLSKITCGDFLNLSLTDRGYLFLMYAGFDSGKTGVTKFVTADLRSRAQKLTDFCATSPKTAMSAAMRKTP